MEKPKEKSILEKWGGKAAALTAILTLVFLLFPYLKPTRTNPTDESLVTDSTPALQDSALEDVLLGTWEQFIFVADTDLRSGGKFLVSRVEDVIVMSAVNQPDDTRSIHTIEISQVQIDGSVWSFVSNQGAGRIVHFELEKVSENVYEGCARFENEIIQCDRWIRIAGP